MKHTQARASIDSAVLTEFPAKHPTPAPDQGPVNPKPSYQILQHPKPCRPIRTILKPESLCLVPGCDHRRRYGHERAYCWGHSIRNMVWDGVEWAPYHSALFGMECRAGKDGGSKHCDTGSLPDRLIKRYARERAASIPTEPPVPGP